MVQANIINGGVYLGHPPDPATSPELSPGQASSTPATSQTPLVNLWETRRNRRKLLVVVGVAVFVLLSALSELFKEAPPKESDPWPSGSSQEAILGSVRASLQTCAQAVVSKPSNCPQVANEAYSETIKAQWELHGSPMDGAVVRYQQKDRLFHVTGKAIMTVRYEDYAQRAILEVKVVSYWAKVSWSDGEAAVVELRAPGQSDQQIVKTDPHLPREALASTLRSAFEKCVSSRGSPMPPECPVTFNSPSLRDATWTLEGDPLLNARYSFDPASGLIRVTGDYAATVRSKELILRESETQAGAYEATLAVDDGVLRVLRIEAKSP